MAREDLFITTKLWNGDQTRVPKAIEQSLTKLRLDYVDPYLMHWPVPSQDNYVQVWREMVKLKEEGLAKALGCVILGRIIFSACWMKPGWCR